MISRIIDGSVCGEGCGGEADDGGQDLFGGFCPSKRSGLTVMNGDELPNGRFQVRDTAMGSAFDLPLCEKGEPAFHLIELGSMSGCEVQMITRPLL